MTRPPDHPTIVGTAEAIDRLGIARATFDAWRRRHPDFPAPAWTIGGRPAWDWNDLTAWLDLTGREHDR